MTQVVAEIGLQHCGCLGTAFAFVDAVADAGVDVAKFQCHDGDACCSFRPGMENYFPQDVDRQAYWRRTRFWYEPWQKLADKCHKRGLQFSCSVFSLAGLEMMAPLVDQIKVPSSKTNDHELLRAVAAIGKPVVLSTGMIEFKEITAAGRFLLNTGCTPTILQCTSEYPTPAEHVGIKMIDRFRIWNPLCSVGLSDHSGTIWPGIAAATLGADMLEVHACWSKQQWGPDVSSSLTIDELAELVRGVRFVEKMRSSSITKDELARELESVRRVFRE